LVKSFSQRRMVRVSIRNKFWGVTDGYLFSLYLYKKTPNSTLSSLTYTCSSGNNPYTLQGTGS